MATLQWLFVLLNLRQWRLRFVGCALTRLADFFEKDEKNFPAHLMKQKAENVRQTIRDIEASTESPELSRIK